MKFYLLILTTFAAFILGTAALQRLTPLHRMESAAQAYIKAHAKDPSSVQYHGHELVQSASAQIYILDFTTLNGFGGPSRERWAFEFDSTARTLLRVTPQK